MNSRRFNRGAVAGLLLATSLFCLSSCDDSEGRLDVDYSAPAKVTDVTSTEGPGEVYLSWTNPTSASLGYTKVVYTNAKGEEVTKMYAKDRADENGRMNVTIGGFITTSDVKFDIYTCAVKGATQGAVEYTCAPGAPAFLAVAQSLTATPDWGSVNVGYKNETVATVFVNIDFKVKNDASKSGNAKFEVAPNTTGSQSVRLWYNEMQFTSGEDVVLSVTAQDADGNASEAKELTVRPKLVKELDRSLWTVPGWVDTYDPQIGYTSQECGGEGAYPNGRVVAMFDGNTNTFWHTRWKGVATNYPHFFIVDMGQEYDNVIGFGFRRRTNNGNTHKGETMYTCTEAGATDLSNPDSWSWHDEGHYAFNPAINNLQVSEFASPVKARYVKAAFATTDRGASQYVMISEFTVYAKGE